MCQSKAEGGLRCAAEAKKDIVKAVESGDMKALKKARMDYYTTTEGIKDLRSKGRDDIADKFEKRRVKLKEKNQKEWRKENGISIAIDLDNTTADFTAGFRACLAKKYGLTKEEAMQKYPPPTDYDMTTWFPGGREEFLAEFWEAEKTGLYRNMSIFKDARKTIKELHNDGFRLHFVTARTQPFNEDTKYALRRYRLPYHLLKHTEAKEEHHAHLFFDDAPKQINTLTVNGKKVVVYDNLYNTKDNGVHRVKSWSEIRETAHKHTMPESKESIH